MPRIDSFDTIGPDPDHLLIVRVRCADAGEALSTLNRIDALLKEVTPTAEIVLIDPAYAREERLAIQEEPTLDRQYAEDRDIVEERRRAEEEARLAAEAKKPPRRVEGRPGLNPAAALAEYDEMETAGGQEKFSGYSAGTRYDGVEILKVQTSKRKGFGVLTLVDGTKVKYDLESGHELERKGGPPSTGDVAFVPSSRMGGPGAPEEDEPRADTNGTPEGEVPGWMAPVVEAETLQAAVAAALTQIKGEDLPAWAVKMRDKVPAFGRVAASKLKGRVERQVARLEAA